MGSLLKSVSQNFSLNNFFVYSYQQECFIIFLKYFNFLYISFKNENHGRLLIREKNQSTISLQADFKVHKKVRACVTVCCSLQTQIGNKSTSEEDSWTQQKFSSPGTNLSRGSRKPVFTQESNFPKSSNFFKVEIKK